MSTATATATAAIPSFTAALISPDLIRELLSKFQTDPASESLWQQVAECRRAVAAQIAALPGAQKSGPGIERARTIMQLFGTAGVPDYPATAEDLRLAQAYRAQGWPGLIAAMLLVAAWQWPEAPALEDVPSWLWADYTEYLFYSPQGFTCVGQADAFGAHRLRRLEELLKLATANRGSSAVRTALSTYVRIGNSLPLYFSRGSLRRHFEIRGKILSIASGVRDEELILARSREGRKLRIGFVSRDFGPRPETYATLPLFEHLDAERFEIQLYAQRSVNARVETYVCGRVAGFQVLPGSVADQVAMLKAAELDIVVFGANVADALDEITSIALHRVAPLQVVSNACGHTSGLPEIDLYVAGERAASESVALDFTERLALIPGASHTFSLETDAQKATTHWTREMLGVPNDVVLFVTAAPSAKITPEVQHAWAKVLAAVPNSRLLVHPFGADTASDCPAKRFAAEFDRVLAAYGVSGDRLLVSTAKLGSRADVAELLRTGDIYLDTFPCAAVEAVLDPMQIGLPVVTCEGETFRSRTTASLLRSIRLDDCVAESESSYIEICTELAKGPARRATLRQRLEDAMNHLPAFIDTLAASDGFGAMIERAYEELCTVGAEVFRSDRSPIRAPSVENPAAVLQAAGTQFSQGQVALAAQAAARVLAREPASTLARQIMGAALLRTDRADRAVTYLVAAIQQAEGNAGLWHDLAIALRRAGHVQDALHALRTSLQLEPAYPDRAAMLNEWMADEMANGPSVNQTTI